MFDAGPRPDWDPDIVASLDDPDSNFDIDNQLDDDFVLQVQPLKECAST